MAHKGKLWPYLFQRDLSLAPGTIERLPQQMVWTGITAGGAKGILINAKTLVSEPGVASYFPGPNVVYKWQLIDGGILKLVLYLIYQLTRQVNMSNWRWEIGGPTQLLSYGAETDTNSSFPTNVVVPVTTNYQPTQLLVTGAGRIDPKRW
jgi:hypothetical protein